MAGKIRRGGDGKEGSADCCMGGWWGKDLERVATIWNVADEMRPANGQQGSRGGVNEIGDRSQGGQKTGRISLDMGRGRVFRWKGSEGGL